MKSCRRSIKGDWSLKRWHKARSCTWVCLPPCRQRSWSTRCLQRFKVGAPDDVDKLVLSAMPGVRLIHAPQVPAAVPVRPGSYYFTLEPRGALYERMIQAQAITIYVPSGMNDLRMELIAANT
jgi:predicted component of type VI protein secretion system